MPLLAGDIIDEARDRHAAFDNRRNPQKVVRRFLASYCVDLAGRINRIDEQALLAESVVAMPLADFNAGIVLPANRGIAGIVAVDNHVPGLKSPVELVPWATRGDANVPLASAWLYGGKLYLQGVASSWRNIVSLAIAYVPDFALLTADADVIPLRQDARLTLVENAALFMAGRGHTDKNLPPIDMKKFVAAAGGAEEEFLKNVSNQLGLTHFRTRDVWSPDLRMR